MISERTFARLFPGFWVDLLPLLTPRLVHLINVGFRKALKDDEGLPIEPIPKNPMTRDAAVISEFAFFLAQISIQEKESITNISKENRYLEIAQKSALDVVTKYEKGSLHLSLPLLSEEKEEGIAIAHNYSRFFKERCRNQPIEFSPKIPGSGFLAECRADISVGSTLFEVKTVDRNLAGKDIRQLVVYLALQNATGIGRWEKAGFFNPRKSIYHEFHVTEIILQMAGGRPASDVFQELIDFVARRDVQFDAAF
jgi:hypothetical protein